MRDPVGGDRGAQNDDENDHTQTKTPTASAGSDDEDDHTQTETFDASSKDEDGHTQDTVTRNEAVSPEKSGLSFLAVLPIVLL